MEYNVLNIKTVAKQVGFYFIRGTTRPGYGRTITNLQIVLNTPPKKSRYPKKYLPKFSLPKKIPKSKIQPPKNPSIFLPCHLKPGVTLPGLAC